MEGCRIICKVIAPRGSEELFQAVKQPTEDAATPELLSLKTAFKNAPTKRLKTQILSLYAYRYSASHLMKLHESVEKMQIEKARAHAKTVGSGMPVERAKKRRVYMDMAKVDHFIEFANRPYFHQDVSFGVRVVKFDSGAQFTMPNVIRTVTKSTLISEYHKHCKESQFEPLSNSTLFRILDTRAASKRKSLQGLDCIIDIAADGATAFDLIEKIVGEVE